MLHEHKKSAKTIEFKKGQRCVSCSNEALCRCPFLDAQNCTFTSETLEALGELGGVLKKIHNRLISEGYTVVNGELKKLDIIKY